MINPKYNSLLRIALFPQQAMDDSALEQLRERNAQRVRACIAEMGRRYLAHPDNRVEKKAAK